MESIFPDLIPDVSVPKIYGMYTDVYLVYSCKLAKACPVKNMLQGGCREQGHRFTADHVTRCDKYKKRGELIT